MKLTDLLIAELDREAPLTKRALEEVPEGKAEWKPHEKSMPLGRLAGLVAMMPSWLAMMIDTEEIDVAPPPGTPSQFSRELNTRVLLLEELANGTAKSRKALLATTDEHLMKPWRLKAHGEVKSEQPRYVMMMETFNHLAHHRGQLTVYLRLNDAKVPSIYGPTADDSRF